DREQIEGDEPQPITPVRPAGEDRADHRGEVLRRLTIALSDGDELAVERRIRGNVHEGCEQRCQPVGEVGAVTRPSMHLSVVIDMDK
ncbi:MAG TPA: hypothetical protein VFT22_43235, partial [Kofleriaceae bacterium]|nr:hypothetical protein [Kofleriaceae bacterium]